MQYNLSNKQIISEANKIRSEFRFSKLEPTQKTFIFAYLKRNKRFLTIIFLLAVLETLIGISLPAISHFYLEKSFDLMNYRTFLIVGISLITLLVIYMVNSFFRIYKTQQFNMKFINDIRECWYTYFLKHSVALKRNFDAKKLMTKFLYHTQLLRMGVQNIIETGIQSGLLYIAILIFSFLFNPKLFLLLWLAFPILIIIFLINDYIGKYYITREQTFNSRIVSHLADSLINFDLIKTQGREKEKLKEFDNLIDIDAFFRVRRQLWIQFSNRILYGIAVLVGIAFYFIQIYWPFIEFDSVTNVASNGLILGYFMKVLFGTARVGLFYEAYTLGLKLVIPTFQDTLNKVIRKQPKWKKLRLHGLKVSLFRKNYIRNFNLNIKKGDRVLIYSEDAKGKSTLANILAGKRALKSIFVSLDGKRITSKKWASFIGNNFYISDCIQYESTIGEILFGKSRQNLLPDDIEKAVAILSSYKEFDFLFEYQEFFGKEIAFGDLSRTQTILLQIAHCLINDKSIITIDHSVIDNLNQEIDKALKILENKCLDSTLIFFSTSNNNNFKYEKKYKLGKAELKEI
jgi:ABC-type multidrug transport system fused ATPase/permease subunit